MKIYLARHGETTWNAEDRVCGRTDVPLTEKGMEQARNLAEKMRDLPIDVILSSPLERARRTAQCVADAKGIVCRTEERLIEQDYGIYEGVSRHSGAFLDNKRQFAVRYPGGESMMQVAARTYALLDEIRRKYRGLNVLLVCHGGVIRVMKTYFEDLSNDSFFHYNMQNCGYVEYEVDQEETAEVRGLAKETGMAALGLSGDRETSVQELKDAVMQFNQIRGWTKRNVQGLAMSIGIEAAELLEIFQWDSPSEAEEKAMSREREHFLEELADVLIYCIRMADDCQVDLAECIREKIKKNALKYPAAGKETD